MKPFKIQETITTRDTNTLKAYYNDIRTIPILTTDEEYEIAYLAHQGDEIAREKLVKHNLRFVISVAKQYVTPHLKLEDLINEGNLGLVVAAKKFDPSRGFKFLSYAVWWIRRYILAYITDNGKTIRVPNNKMNIVNKINQKFNTLEQQLNREPTYDELYEAVSDEFNEDDLDFYFLTTNSHMSSLDAQISGEDFSSTKLSDMVADKECIDASYFVDKNDTEQRTNAMLRLLNKDLEREVIKLIYGLDGKGQLPLKTVGWLLGITSERVRQLRDSALRQLKNKMK